ncbi:hypothetical protein [Streptomyces sp. NPDC001781]
MTDVPTDPWPVYWTCDVGGYSPELTGYAVNAATRILWSLSGRRFGLTTAVLRPCAEDCQGVGGYPFTGSWEWGAGYALPPWDFYRTPYCCGGCAGRCSCGLLTGVRLPSPVDSIASVRVDGAVLDPAAYRLDGGQVLVRTDGARWPRCNDLSRPDTAPGTWSVTARLGEPVPDSGRLAMGELACEIAKAGSGVDCRLPAAVTQLVRQGVTISVPDFGQMLFHGKTGLYLVDMFLTAENPHRLQRRPRVYDVDRIAQRRTGA